MTSLIYESSVSACLHNLNNLSALLDKAEAYATEKKFDIDVLIQARLAPDMLPFGAQVMIACTFAKNLCCRLAGQEPPDFERGPASIEASRALIERTIGILKAIKPEDMEDAESREITFNTGPQTKMTLPGGAYMNRFALPNVYFHITTAYDLLRHNGVPIGKADFMGALEQ